MKREPSRPKSREMRVVFSPGAYERILLQAVRIDQTPASFARQVIMEKVIALESAGANSDSVSTFAGLQELMKEMTKEISGEAKK